VTNADEWAEGGRGVAGTRLRCGRKESLQGVAELWLRWDKGEAGMCLHCKFVSGQCQRQYKIHS
jgi:hypothetical protein